MGNESSKGGSPIKVSMVAAGLKELPAREINAKKHKLDVLNLTCNRISGSIDISHLTNLQALILWGNHFSALKLPKQGQLSRLKTVDLGNNDLKDFPAGLGHACPSITDLNLSGNRIEAIPSEDLAACRKLSVLKIQNNCLTSLPESLATLGDLKVLLAHGNFISEVPCLGTCLKLEDLQLNENATSQLPDDVFLGLPALHNLDLIGIMMPDPKDFSPCLPVILGHAPPQTGNQLRRLPTSIWRLKKLKTLRAARNMISDLGAPDEAVEPLQFLDTVNLSMNEIEVVPDALLNCWAYVVTLDLQYNSMGAIPSSIAALLGVDTLRLGHNMIRTLPQDIQTLPKLTELYLNNNRLSDDTESLEALGRCICLRTLDLSFNNLAECPPSVSRLPYLHRLSLAGNRISHFDVRIPSLTSAVANPFALQIILDLSLNQLSRFPSCIFDMKSLEEIRLFGNRLTLLPNKENVASKLTQLKVLSLTADVPEDDALEFCDFVRRNCEEIIRIYLDNSYEYSSHGCVAWETENAHKGERGLFRQQHQIAMRGNTPESLAFTYAGAAQITGSASHPIEDRFSICHLRRMGKDYFGLFDGHAGDFVADTAKECFPEQLEEGFEEPAASIEETLHRAFMAVNAAVKARIGADTNSKSSTSGSTSVVVLVDKRFIICGNTGDSKALIIGIDESGATMASLLSTNHNPGYREEWDRIREHGGYVTERPKAGGLIVESCRLVVPRDDGGFQSLGVSRSLGDFHCAPAMSGVTAALTTQLNRLGEPSIICREIAATDKYLLLCTDGLTDVISEIEIAVFALEAIERATQHALAHKTDDEDSENPRRKNKTDMLESVAQWLCLRARSLGSVDDVSAVLVELPSWNHFNHVDIRSQYQ